MYVLVQGNSFLAWWQGRLTLPSSGRAFGTPLKSNVRRLHMATLPYDIGAEIYFLHAAEGGRSNPALDDYRPQFSYDGHDWDARHLYPDVRQVNPGDTVRAYLGFLSPDEHLGRVYVNMPFGIREGGRVVGRGKVTKIIELAESARRVGQHGV